MVDGLLRHWRRVPRADAKAEATDEPAHGALLVLSACLALGLRLANACQRWRRIHWRALVGRRAGQEWPAATSPSVVQAQELATGSRDAA